MKRMKRIMLVILTMLLLVSGPLKAQVFIADDEFEGVLRRGESEFVLVAPIQGTDADQYTPIGNGLFFMIGLGTAYLLAKRKDSQRQSE